MAEVTVEMVTAIVKGTVPGATGIDTSQGLIVGQDEFGRAIGDKVVTWGELGANNDHEEFYEGALIVNHAGEAVTLGQSIFVVNVRNPAQTPFHGRDEGVALVGYLETVVDGAVTTRTFVLPNFDVLYTRPGFVKGVHAIDDAQGLCHEGGLVTDKVGRDGCQQ